MKTVFYGHACLRMEGSGRGACLVDPWFSRNGAFFRSWFQYPENAPFRERALAGALDLLVSHNHADHFDPETLIPALRAEPERRLHIARFATPWFRDRAARFLPGLEDRIVVHEPWQRFETDGGVEAFFVPEESPGQIDSALVFLDGDEALVNLNDARLNTRQLERIRDEVGRVSVLALQASGASEYPVNYLYPGDEMRRRCLEKRDLKFEACARVFDLLRPERVLFFAGPPVFLDPDLEDQNLGSEFSVFPNQLDVLGHYASARPDIAARSYFALPGETLGDELLFSRLDLESERARPFRDRLAYVREYRERRPEIDFASSGRVPPPDEAALRAHFERMAGLSEWMNERIDGELVFVVEGGGRESAWTVDFASGTARPGAAPNPLYVLRAPAFEVEAILAGEATWDDAFLSIRMVFDERTERFVSHFKTLLKYMDADTFEELRRYEEGLATETDERRDDVEVACGGRRYLVQRLCPHAGVDLGEHGVVDEATGTIVCAAHRFRFDLGSGACLNAKGFALRVRELKD